MNNFVEQITDVKQSLTKNRTEHLGRDVWKDFVVPRFFKKIDLMSDMPTRLEGGRGSGKTMVLRYLSYQSQFSTNRKAIPLDALGRVGLYWKADTQFLRLLQKRGLEESDWVLIFQHYLTLKIALEVVESVIRVYSSDIDGLPKLDISDVKLGFLEDFGLNSGCLGELEKEIKSLLIKTEVACQNIGGIGDLIKLPQSFVDVLVAEIKNGSEFLKDTVFCVYIDEYENLLSYQQKVINTRIKHSEPPLIFNIAIKINGMSETLTLGEERIENRADYQIVNLENEIFGSEFEAYVAEIFIKKIIGASPFIKSCVDIDESVLGDPARIEERMGDEYVSKVKDLANRFLPGRSHGDLAEEVFETPRYYKKLKDEIRRALVERGSKYSAEDFICVNNKKASIVNSSLLFRERLDVQDVFGNFSKLKEGCDNKYYAPTAWEHNNFIGSYLRIVTAYKGNSSFYSGFDVFTVLSSGNVRHFLELCRTAFSIVSEKQFSENLCIDQKTQHMAARLASDELFREISRFTPWGVQLTNLVSGLGGLFQDCQSRESQSEPEIIHFSLKGDASDFSSEDRFLLEEAVKWGVLKTSESTKNKSSSAITDYEYILNPIYSPFFFITYRKNRKIEIGISDLRGLYEKGRGYLQAMKRNPGLAVGGDSDKQGVLL